MLTFGVSESRVYEILYYSCNVKSDIISKWKFLVCFCYFLKCGLLYESHWIGIPALTFTSHMTIDKLLGPCCTQFPHLYFEDNSTALRGCYKVPRGNSW